MDTQFRVEAQQSGKLLDTGSRLHRLLRGLLVVTISMLVTGIAPALCEAPPPGDQSTLQPVVDTGGRELEFDWPMIRIGTAEYREGPTGVTVFRFGRKVLATYDVRGEPGTANTEMLNLSRDRATVDAVVLSGGSLYGLESTTAVASAMKDDGLRTGALGDVGYATGAIIYDLGDRRLNEVYPDKRLAQAAFRAARPGVFRVGAAGAGRFAMTGYFFGLRAHSGQGGAYFEKGNIKIACFTVVNALGAVTDRKGRIMAGYPDPAWPHDLGITDLLQVVKNTWGGSAADTAPSQNTTISLVVVNQKLSIGDLQRVARQVHTSMSRGLQPYATEYDGDVLFAVSTGEVDLPQNEKERTATLALIPTVASEVMWDAILTSVPEQPRPQRPIHVTTPLPAKHAGRYTFSRFVTVDVTATNGRLFARATGQRDAYAIGRDKAVELLPVAPSLDRFTIARPSRYPLTLDFSSPGVVIINPGPWAQIGKKE